MKLLFLLPLVLLLTLTACATPTPAANTEAECAPVVCPVEITAVPPPAENSTRPSPSSLVPRISIDELRQKMESKANILVVDNRSKAEYDVDHIKGAISIPLATIIEGGWTPPVDKELIFYCA